MVDYTDDEIAPVPGPLIFASVDPFLTVTLDVDGNMMRQSSEVTREPDTVNHADLSLVVPVNRGADRAAERGQFVDIGAPMTEPDRVELPERLTLDSVRELMRHKVQGRDGSPLGGGGGGRRRTKPIKIVASPPVGREVGAYVPFFRVSGLTPGERDFFHRRPNIARTVLRDIVGQIIRNELVEPVAKVERLTFAFDVYGLGDPEIRILRAYRNAVRLALIDHARSIDPARIRMIDGNAPATALRTYEQIARGEYA